MKPVVGGEEESMIASLTTREAIVALNCISVDLKYAFTCRCCEDCKKREAGKACDDCTAAGWRHLLCPNCGWCDYCQKIFLEPTFPLSYGPVGYNTLPWWCAVLEWRNGGERNFDFEPAECEVELADNALLCVAAAREQGKGQIA